MTNLLMWITMSSVRSIAFRRQGHIWQQGADPSQPGVMTLTGSVPTDKSMLVFRWGINPDPSQTTADSDERYLSCVPTNPCHATIFEFKFQTFEDLIIMLIEYLHASLLHLIATLRIILIIYFTSSTLTLSL